MSELLIRAIEGADALLATRVTPLPPAAVRDLLALLHGLAAPDPAVQAWREYKWVPVHEHRTREERARGPVPAPVPVVARSPHPPGPPLAPGLTSDEKAARAKEAKRRQNLAYRAKVKARAAPPAPGPASVAAEPPPKAALPKLSPATAGKLREWLGPPPEAGRVLALSDENRRDIEDMLAEGHAGRRIAADLILPLTLVAEYVTARRRA